MQQTLISLNSYGGFSRATGPRWLVRLGYDPSKYDTYLEQLHIHYPTVR